MSRCWGCCQENCGFQDDCGCSCHAGNDKLSNSSFKKFLEDYSQEELKAELKRKTLSSKKESKKNKFNKPLEVKIALLEQQIQAIKAKLK